MQPVPLPGSSPSLPYTSADAQTQPASVSGPGGQRLDLHRTALTEVPSLPFPGLLAQDGLPAYASALGLLSETASSSAATSTVEGQAWPPMMLAASNGDVAALTALLAEPGIDVDQVGGKDGETALICAAREGHLDIVRLLVKQPRISLDICDTDGMNALMHAAAHDHKDVAACLLAAGAAINYVNPTTGMTPLICASGQGHLEIAKLFLLHADVELDYVAPDGCNALMSAVLMNQPNVVAWLLAAGAAVNFNDAGLTGTALDMACMEGNLDIVKLLLRQRNIDLDKAGPNGVSALMTAAICNRPDMVACLIAAGASTEVADDGGNTAFEHAVAEGHTAVIRILQKH